MKTDIKEICCKDVNWIQRVQNKAYKQTFVKIIINFMFHTRGIFGQAELLSAYFTVSPCISIHYVFWSN
jgi:hypothetical protein